MTKFYNKTMQIGDFILDRVLHDKEKVLLYISQKDVIKGIILDIKNTFFLPSSPCNLINLALLNNHNIFYDNKNMIFYNL